MRILLIAVLAVAGCKHAPTAESSADGGEPSHWNGLQVTTKVSGALAFTKDMTRPVPEPTNGPVQYPPEPEAQRQGLVILKCVITAEGDVRDCRLVKSVQHLLDMAVHAAVLTWKFKPATLNGQPVTVDYVLPIRILLPTPQGPAKTSIEQSSEPPLTSGPDAG